MTKENIEKTLTELGAHNFQYPDTQNEWMYFRVNSRYYGLNTSTPPFVRLLSGYRLSEEFDLDLAKETAEILNKDIIGLYVQVEDDREMAIVCLSTAVTCYTFNEILPYMAESLDEIYFQFLRRYYAAVSAKKKPMSKIITS